MYLIWQRNSESRMPLSGKLQDRAMKNLNNFGEEKYLGGSPFEIWKPTFYCECIRWGTNYCQFVIKAFLREFIILRGKLLEDLRLLRDTFNLSSFKIENQSGSF